MAHIQDGSDTEQINHRNGTEHLNGNMEFMRIINEADSIIREAIARPSKFRSGEIEREWAGITARHEKSTNEEEEEFISDHAVSQRLNVILPQLKVFLNGAAKTGEMRRWGTLRETPANGIVPGIEVTGVTPSMKKSFRLKRVGHYTLYEPNSHTPQFEDDEAKVLTDAIIHSWARSAAMESGIPYKEAAKRSAHVLEEILSYALKAEEFTGLHTGKISTRLILAAVAINEIPAFLTYQFEEDSFTHAIVDNLQEEFGRDKIRFGASLMSLVVFVWLTGEKVSEVIQKNVYSDFEKLLGYLVQQPADDVKLTASILAFFLSFLSVARKKAEHPLDLVNENRWVIGMLPDGQKEYGDADKHIEFDEHIFNHHAYHPHHQTKRG